MKPILDMLKNYIFSNSARFHMPGHKGASSEELFENVFPCDITELDFSDVKGLRLEAAQKLAQLRPATVGQALRISGVSPADANVLMVYLKALRQ